MSNYIIHDTASAPEKSKDLLVSAERKFGSVPNLLGIMAEAPATLKSYLALSEALDETSFTAVERQVIALAVSYEAECSYCMAAHSAIATMARMSDANLEALRTGEVLGDPRLEALRKFSVAVVASRGRVSAEQQSEFAAAGFSQTQVLEVLVGVAMKTLSNYVNHIAGTPLDANFARFAWSPELKTARVV